MRVSHQIDPLKMIYFELECCPESYLKSEDRNSFFEIICQYSNIGDSDSHVWCVGQFFAASGRISMKLDGIVDQINKK